MWWIKSNMVTEKNLIRLKNERKKKPLSMRFVVHSVCLCVSFLCTDWIRLNKTTHSKREKKKKTTKTNSIELIMFQCSLWPTKPFSVGLKFPCGRTHILIQQVHTQTGAKFLDCYVVNVSQKGGKIDKFVWRAIC